MPAEFLEATRASYDTIAAAYTDRFPNRPGDWHPLDRSLIGAFAELAAVHAPAPVADLGSGPGAVTAHLHGLGLTVFGVDLSPGMVALARRAHPAPRFHVGSMKDVDLTYHWRTPETVAERLAEAGLWVTARVLREPVGEEKRPRAFLLAEKPMGLTPR
ncbi:class I SAM-dependent methyltransferase [Streptomyces nigra]|uniref:class I SAM-dependent methyltransferase n=1 Tax=Streptomyces nigra TaxID=1827580 RepID=UPI0037D46B31